MLQFLLLLVPWALALPTDTRADNNALYNIAIGKGFPGGQFTKLHFDHDILATRKGQALFTELQQDLNSLTSLVNDSLSPDRATALTQTLTSSFHQVKSTSDFEDQDLSFIGENDELYALISHCKLSPDCSYVVYDAGSEGFKYSTPSATQDSTKSVKLRRCDIGTTERVLLGIMSVGLTELILAVNGGRC
ncbi:hypothetical protein PV10_02377 [Exophiala mesophila]|uniref:Uncharacterized protein n=1 Tax=Exophiala mesophila TaxID=212818 RepID=A0A0D1Y252_EXOME|nr:uncharacterized protein PV10_02377 [Exophiala mesophila]KIV94626.1 hypothetical protein PV10_02377 [Exophiala mesophila]